MDAIKAAQWFARRGHAIFPIWPPNDDGSCSCKDPHCKSPGKHPLSQLVPHGLNDASTDLRAINEWWGGWPDANIGMRTGKGVDGHPGTFGVDIDPAKGGFNSWDQILQQHGQPPDTLMAQTGGDGVHIFLEMPEMDIRNSASLLGPGIDIRANGGYLVVPSSRHANGQTYRWIESKKPILPPPDWLIEKLAEEREKPSILPDVIPEGGRNDWMTTAAGAMRRVGFGEGEILNALSYTNNLRCRPPLAMRELTKIAQSMMRYAPDKPSRVSVGGKKIVPGFRGSDLMTMLGR